MAFKQFGVVLLLLIGAMAVVNGLVPLRVHVLVPKENPSFSAEGTLPAMELAIDDINNNSDLLKNYNLSLIITDTQCDPPEGTWQLISTQMKYNREIQMVFGGGCSLVTEPTAALTSRFYETIQIAYAASSPVLSDRQMYRYFFRVNPSETISNILRFALMKKYNWQRVATLHQTRNLFSRTVEHFYDNLKILGSNFTRTNESSESTDDDGATLFSFTDDPDIPLTQIREKKIRIVFGFMYEDKAVVVMCYAYHMGLNTSNHQWIMPGWYSDNWWDKAENVTWSDYKYNCTSDQIRSMVNYSLLLDAYLVTEYLDEVGVSGRDYNSYNISYQKRLDNYFMDTQHRQHLYAGVAYDGLWAIAMTLNESETALQEMNCSLGNLTGCPSMDRANLTKMFFNFMNTTNFTGVSGHVRFDENGTRIGTSVLYQYQPILPDGGLEKVLLVVHDEESDQLVLNFTKEPIWEGGRPPADRSTPNSRFLNKPLIYVSNVFISFGIVVAFAMFIFNLVTIRKPLIANSAPIINAVIIVGCVMLLVGCYLLGIDSGTPQVNPDIAVKEILTMIDDYSSSRYAIICTTRLWILTVGFTLSFGALFAKTWQAYRIYTTPVLKNQPFKYCNFVTLMILQLFVDANFLWVWTTFFRFRHDIENKPNAETDVVDKFEVCRCDEFPYLIGALYVYKGLLVIFGLFLAYESRNVKYKYLNDSRFVSVAMYLVVILIGITAPLSLVLSTQFFIDAAYGLSVFMVVLAVLCCLLILFIPKFVYMAKGLDTMLPAAKTETFTPVDGLQLGKTEVNPDDLEIADKEIKHLEKEVQQKEYELEELQRQNRRGSDDSGVHCISETIDSNTSAHTPDNLKEPADHFGAKEP